MDLIAQYTGLKREQYILFVGRIANTMGQVVWPTMTLVLSNKLGYSASGIAALQFVMLFLQLPFTYIGGKLADRTNKKWNIVVCDTCVATCFFICAAMPVSILSVWVFFLAGSFAMVELSSYETLVADLARPAERERAYSLSYLGMNLGFVVAPVISGLLFEEHLRIFFLVCGISTLFASLLILFAVREVSAGASARSLDYEVRREGESCWRVLRGTPVVLGFILLHSLSYFIYYNFFFLVPLNMEKLYGAAGAVYYGYMSSTNGIVVITMTAVLVALASRFNNFIKIFLGETAIVLGLSFFVFAQRSLPLCFAATVVFTMGEILTTVSKQPFIIARIPSSHRGRIFAVISVGETVLRAILQVPLGMLADIVPMPAVWAALTALGGFSLLLYLLLIKKDQKTFRALWATKT